MQLRIVNLDTQNGGNTENICYPTNLDFGVTDGPFATFFKNNITKIKEIANSSITENNKIELKVLFGLKKINK